MDSSSHQQAAMGLDMDSFVIRYPTGVCIDSTNIVYVRCTDKNNCVPVTH